MLSCIFYLRHLISKESYSRRYKCSTWRLQERTSRRQRTFIEYFELIALLRFSITCITFLKDFSVYNEHSPHDFCPYVDRSSVCHKEFTILRVLSQVTPRNWDVDPPGFGRAVSTHGRMQTAIKVLYETLMTSLCYLLSRKRGRVEEGPSNFNMNVRRSPCARLLDTWPPPIPDLH